MYRFLSKTGFFIVLFLAYMAIMFVINSKLYSRKIANIPVASTLIMGNSHVNKLHDIFFQNSHNLSSSGETYKTSYIKLEHYLNEHSDSLNNIILAFSFMNIGSYQTKMIDSMYADVVRTYAYMSSEGINQKVKSNGLKMAMKYYFSFQNNLIFDLLGISDNWVNPVYLGRNSDLNIKASEIKDVESEYTRHWNEGTRRYFVKLKLRIDKHFGKEKPAKTSQIAIKYLKKIVNLCYSNNIKLHLVNMPKSKPYRNLVPGRIKKRHNILADSLANLPHVNYLDYSTYFDDQIGYMSDQDHITHYGGKLIASELKKSMRKQ